MNTTALHTTRTAANIEIDAQAERTDDGRFAVSIAVITDGIAGREPWYADTLDTLTQGDLDKLADEALESFAR